MIILILALIFGAAVLLLTIKFLISSSKSGKTTGTVTKILSCLVAIEAIAFLIIFVIVFVKTLAT